MKVTNTITQSRNHALTNTFITGILMLITAVSGLRAQDTIDTNYYRYDYHYTRGSGPKMPTGYHNQGHMVPACPNGFGFDNSYWWIPDTVDGVICCSNSWVYLPYFRYELSKDQKIHGIAVAIDSIRNFTFGDSLTVILCKANNDSTGFIHLDSITIKGGEIGKRRWMEIPITYYDGGSYDFSLSQYQAHGQFDDCIDTIIYSQVLEFYFDRPIHIDGTYLWWHVKISNKRGSDFIIHYRGGYNSCGISFYWEDCKWGGGRAVFTPFFPIITPLPEWEVASLEQVIPWPAGAVIPDPQSPNDPGNPQNPDDPINPETPDNSGDTEGIDDNCGSTNATTVHPNPTTGQIHINTAGQPITSITIHNTMGQLVTGHWSPVTDHLTIDLSPLPAGVYYMTVKSGETTTRHKVIKVN